MARGSSGGQHLTAQALRSTPTGTYQIEAFKKRPFDNYERLVVGVTGGRDIESEMAVQAVDRAFSADADQSSIDTAQARVGRDGGTERRPATL
ncbi:hypothetical protein MMC10_006140 [Thelotrema lepadinum]|nr:hypothetical protein [Thelotrema lepadinum]